MNLSKLKKGKALLDIRRLLKLKEKQPLSPKYTQWIGDFYLMKGDREEAIKNYFNSASLYERIKDYNKAIAIYKKILKLSPYNYEAYNKIAELFVKAGLVGDAKQFYLSLAKLYYENRRFIDALNTLDKILSFDPENIEVLKISAEIAEKEGMSYIGAQKFFKIADVYYKRGEFDKALYYYKKGLKLEPEERLVKERIEEIKSRFNMDENKIFVLDNKSSGVFEGIKEYVPTYKRIDITPYSRRFFPLNLNTGRILLILIGITLILFLFFNISRREEKSSPSTESSSKPMVKPSPVNPPPPKKRDLGDELRVLWRSNTRSNGLINITLITPKQIKLLNKIEARKRGWDAKRGDLSLIHI